MRLPRAVQVLLAAVVLSGAAASSAMATSPAQTVITGNGWTCTRTQPEYMVHAGGARLAVQPDSYKFTITSLNPNPGSLFAPALPGFDAGNMFDDPYITAGYNGSLNATLCDNREYRGAHNSRAYLLPVQLGRQGRPVASVHDITSPYFSGDAGLDIWLAGSPAWTTYAQLTNGGSATTEIMIWLSHPRLGAQTSSLSYYPVVIGGRHWMVTVGLAAYGHGATSQRAGWNVVNFIAPDYRTGSVTARGLKLNLFMAYAIRHGWLSGSDWLMAVDDGFEIRAGSASVTGWQLTGLPLPAVWACACRPKYALAS